MTDSRALLLVLMALLAACQTTQSPQSAQAPELPLTARGGDSQALLTGPEWQVRTIDGEKVIEGSRITLHFTDDGKVHGRTGCNLYDGGYQMTGEGLTISPLSQTRMACAPSVMKQEQDLIDVLQSVERFRIDDAGVLVLEGSDYQILEANRR